MSLSGKIAVVTGAGSGMGLATVQAFVREGATVYAFDISQDNLERELSSESAVTTIALDIADSAAVNAAFAQVNQAHGKLDILINAAGVNTPNRQATEWLDNINHSMLEHAKKGEPFAPDFLSEIPDEDFERVMKINVHGTFYAIRAAAPLLKAAGGGAIVNFASVAGLVGLPMPAYYPASKAAVVGMTRSLSGELAPFNIRVNALAPAGINTALLTQSGEDHVQALLSLQPLKRLAEPEEIAETLVFLASDAGAHYTGQVLSPSGGAYLA
ncbi:SDR family NAD(P)-dependent oxidoreductase [Corynebacterium sp. A21]|uniref:SDR family NAD(P)-dependent oxidoreductase n=1 Tax=Corynebacterium sp. A21 TaxID=3457318 RepID=UPI003FD4DF5E